MTIQSLLKLMIPQLQIPSMSNNIPNNCLTYINLTLYDRATDSHDTVLVCLAYSICSTRRINIFLQIILTALNIDDCQIAPTRLGYHV